MEPSRGLCARRLGHLLPADRQGALRRRARGRRRGDEPLHRRGRPRADRRRVRAARGRDRTRRRPCRTESPLVIEERGTNVMMHRVFTWGDVDAAFAADHVFTRSSAGTASAPTRWRPSAASAEWDPIDPRPDGARQLPVALAHGARPRDDLRPAVQQGAHDQPPARRQLRRQGRPARHRHLDPALAQGGRPAGQVDRGPHGVPGRPAAARPGTATTRFARRQGRRNRHRPQGEAPRRPRRQRRGLRRHQRREAAGGLHGPYTIGAASTTSRSSRPTSAGAAPTAAWARRRTTSCSSR